MGAEAARVLDYDEYYGKYNHGSAAPELDLDAETKPMPARVPGVQEQIRRKESERAAARMRKAPAVSFPAAVGALIITVLFIFVMLAQIQYNEAASETVRLNNYIFSLMEQRRTLEIAFESIIDMKEVERFARDELGMSRPEKERIFVVRDKHSDRAEVFAGAEGTASQSFGEFLSSLTRYIKR